MSHRSVSFVMLLQVEDSLAQCFLSFDALTAVAGYVWFLFGTGTPVVVPL